VISAINNWAVALVSWLVVKGEGGLKAAEAKHMTQEAGSPAEQPGLQGRGFGCKLRPAPVEGSGGVRMLEFELACDVFDATAFQFNHEVTAGHL
jgi:hypothetical protein